MNEGKASNAVKLQLMSLMLTPTLGLLITGWFWHSEAVAAGHNTGVFQIAMITAIIAMTIVSGTIIIRRISKESSALNHALCVIAEGDLSKNSADYSQTGAAEPTLHHMRENLTKISQQLQSTTQRVQDNSRDISENNTLLAQRSELQASNLERTSASMEEITITVAQNADDASEGNMLSKQAMEHATEGQAIVANAIKAMAEINNDSKKIAEIIKLIDDIAFQTNLLALNAAVEAARAGDQGRGFAVVATEVRNLAGRSAEAASDIKKLIEESLRKVENGSNLVQDSGQSLNGIVKSVEDVLQIMEKISSASVEQASGVSQINQSILELDDSNQQNAAMVEEVAVASKELQEQAHSLNETASFFSVDQTTPSHSKASIRKHSQTKATHNSPAKKKEPTERRSTQRPWASNSGQMSKTPSIGSPVPKAAGSNENWESF